MALIRQVVKTEGAAGQASGSAETEELWLGFLDMVQAIYNPAAPATTTVEVKEARPNGRVLFRKENNNVSGEWYPRHETHDDEGNVEAAPGEMYLTEGQLVIEVTGCDALDEAVEVVLQIAYPKGIL